MTVFPNYNDGSIVNLMSSISKALGTKSMYRPLKALPPSKLKRSKNVILLVIDGLGYNCLKTRGAGTALEENLLGPMTSVFPSTTASAITTLHTAVAPQQHAMTGWHMHLKEIGVVMRSLPFNPRIGGPSLDWVEMDDVIGAGPLTKKLGAKCFTVVERSIYGSGYTVSMTAKSERLGFTTITGLFRQVSKAVRSNGKKKYIYAYWSELDSINHEHGSNSRRSKKHFQELNRRVESFIESIKGTRTSVIVTSDHGFIDTTKGKTVHLKNHPKLEGCLTLPLCGEGRAVYCYVRPSKSKDFEQYVRRELSNACTLHRSQTLIKKGLFGLFKPDKRLFDRVGDYILLMKENYVMRDSLLGQKPKHMVGNHGGISDDEMLVPLVVFEV